MNVDEILNKYYSSSLISEHLKDDLKKFVSNQLSKKDKQIKEATDECWIHRDMNVETQKENTKLKEQLKEANERVKELDDEKNRRSEYCNASIDTDEQSEYICTNCEERI